MGNHANVEVTGELDRKPSALLENLTGPRTSLEVEWS
jgi:hypothetical protein